MLDNNLHSKLQNYLSVSITDPQPFKGCGGDVACLLEAVAVKTLDKQKMKHLKAAAPSGGDSWFFLSAF